jgi:hypothetical protein
MTTAKQINPKTGMEIINYPRKPKIDGRRRKDRMLEDLYNYADKMRWALRSRRDNPRLMYENTSLAGKEDAYAEMSDYIYRIMKKGK